MSKKRIVDDLDEDDGVFFAASSTKKPAKI